MAPAALALAVAPACSAPSGEAASVAIPRAGGTAAGPAARASAAPTTRIDEITGAKVFDPSGNAGTCAPPAADCPPLPVERAFLDRCRLAGFQVRQCGCAARCSGDVAAAGRGYTLDGTPRECAPARPECAPPAAGARFQDACNEKGFRLEVCGCEWLCSGNPAK